MHCGVSRKWRRWIANAAGSGAGDAFARRAAARDGSGNLLRGAAVWNRAGPDARRYTAAPPDHTSFVAPPECGRCPKTPLRYGCGLLRVCAQRLLTGTYGVGDFDFGRAALLFFIVVAFSRCAEKATTDTGEVPCRRL